MAEKQENKLKLWKQHKRSFTVVGVAKVNDYTVQEETSESGFKYRKIRLGVQTEEGNTVYCEAMGGYFPNRDENKLYVQSKEDYKQFDIAWEDRFNEEVIKSINPLSLITIGLEKTDKDKTYYKNFVSWFDACDYVKQHIKDGMVVRVQGELKYSEYNDKLQVRKEIQSIVLSAATPDKYGATFIQSVLLQKDAIDKSHVKDDGELDIVAQVLDYDREAKVTRPYNVIYKVALNKDNKDKITKVLEKFVKVSKSDVVRVLNIEGIIREGTEISQVKPEDIDPEMRELIEMGIYDEEEIINKMTVKGNSISKLYFTRPYIKKNKETEKLEVEVNDDFYKPSDLIFEVSEKKTETTASVEVSDDELDDLLSDLDNL